VAAPRGYGKDGIYSITVATAVTAFIIEAVRGSGAASCRWGTPGREAGPKKSGESP